MWDWSSVSQAESNFALQQSFEKQGVAFWWLDWCCDESIVSMPGLTPDSWIDHLYAQEMVNQGQRGFVLARIGSSNDDPVAVFPAGPWSDHTSTIAFTGDAWATWNTLAREVALTPDEATIGEPYVSDDIGSYLGTPPLGAPDPADLYDRWVQLGTFQPILRLHSQNEARLPWEYPQPVRAITEDFLRLREALIPYTYTLAAQAHDDGLPITQPLYLEYPGQAAAYTHPEEYLDGSEMLVAPVTSPGSVADTTALDPARPVGRLLHRGHLHGADDHHLGRALESSGRSHPGRRHHPRAIAHLQGGDHGQPHGPQDFLRGQGFIPSLRRQRYRSRLYEGTVHRDIAHRHHGDHGCRHRRQCARHHRVCPGSLPGRTGRRQLPPRPGGPDPAHPGDVERQGPVQRPSVSDGQGWSYQPSTATIVVTTTSLSTDRTATVVASGARPVSRSEPSVPTS